MQLLILAVGRLKAGAHQELFSSYLERLLKIGPAQGISTTRLIEIAESRARAPQQRSVEESEKILAEVPPGSFLITLDARGKNIESTELAQRLFSEKCAGRARCVFALGGADGHASALLDRSDFTLAFGKMTWPHQLARIMLVEQLYRSLTIMAGHPYHRA